MAKNTFKKQCSPKESKLSELCARKASWRAKISQLAASYVHQMNPVLANVKKN